MPGSIHVTVLEAVDLPVELKESPELVAVKVSLANQEFTTGYRRFETKSTGSWDSDFAFPVLNLKDKLGFALCDSKGKILTKCEIEVPSILQHGYREEYVELSEGGRLHLKLSFVLTDEERKKVNEMRAAAQRKKEKEQKDDMMRAYDFKRKEEYCTDNRLRTFAENKVEHAGQPLDNWEVFSRTKDREVSPASLFALPQPTQPPNFKPSSSVERGKPVEISADRERCSKNKYISPCSIVQGVLCHSSLNQDNIMEGTVRTSSPEPSVPACSPSETAETARDSEIEVVAGPSKGPVAENTKAASFVLSETDEQKENRPAPLTSADSTCSMVDSQDDHVSCHAPEVEECMENRLLEKRQEVKKELPSNQGFSRPREENPFFPKVMPINNLVEPGSDTDGTHVPSVVKETKASTLQVLAPKENVTTFQETPSLVQGVVAAVRMSTFSEWESVRKMPRVKEMERISPKVSHAHVVNDFPFELQNGNGEKNKTVASTTEPENPMLEARENGEKIGTLLSPPDTGKSKLGVVGVGVKVKSVAFSPNVGSPKLGVRGSENGGPLSSSVEVDSVDISTRGAEGKINLLSAVPDVDGRKVGLYQLEATQTGSQRLLRTAMNSYEAGTRTVSKAALSSYETCSPKFSQTSTKVEKIPGLLSRLLSDDSNNTEKEYSKLMATTPVPMDGWVCVERPPMTWEDALKVAQKAREAALAVKQQAAAPFPLPSPLRLPTCNVAGPPSPVATMRAAKSPSLFNLPSLQDVVCAPLPCPPSRSSPSKSGITAGYVKSRKETYDSGSHQTLDQASGKCEKIIIQTETASSTGVQIALRERRSAEEELIKWEERLRTWGQAAELKVIQEEPRHRNEDRERQLSWDMDDFENSIREDFEARLQSPSSDCESTSSRLAVPAAEVKWDVEEATRSKWLREDSEPPITSQGCLDLFEDLQVEDMEESLMEEVSKHEITVETLVSDIVLCEETRAKLDDPDHSARSDCTHDEIIILEQNSKRCMEEDAEAVTLHVVAEKDYDIESGNDVSDILNCPIPVEAREKTQQSVTPESTLKLRSGSELVPSAFAIRQLSFSGHSLWAPKGQKKPKAKARESVLVSNFIRTDDLQQFNAPEAWLAKAMIDQCSGAKADLIIESLCKSLEPASDFLSPREQTPESIRGEDSGSPTEEEKRKNPLIGGSLKQVLGGAVLAAGVFALWPKNGGKTERYHVVKSGETLSNILPGQVIDPSSNFCKLNPQVCERNTVYPGQRLRLA